ncbi:MAG: DNA mismatch repair protein MutS, partial [Flavobacteriaceae bacterium]|nr:DNA mismatch repair protein MutS [Flavobacteriaceae bacterium]
MQNPLEFYESEKLFFEKELSSLKKKLATSSTIRLIVFLATAFGIYFFFQNTNILVGIIIIGITFFLYLIVKHTDLQLKRDLIKALIKINKTEIQIQNRDYFDLDDGSEFIDPKHLYSYDIDLFGKGSFFQYCNRTTTNEGKKKLVKTLLENDISSIKSKQESIKELSQKPKWRQQFSAVASLSKVQYSAKLIVAWIHNYEFAFPKFLAFFPLIFLLISMSIIILIGLNIINFQAIVIWFFIGLGFTGAYLKKINILYENASKAKDTFKQYHVLLDQIEMETFHSKILIEKQQAIQVESKKASLIFSQFSKTLDALDQRNNILIAIVANGLFLRDLKISMNIEKWIKNYHHQVENWFEVIAFFDTQNSLANFDFNHPNYVFPKINTTHQVIKSKNLGHVLLNKSQRIDNDFNIKNEQFFIITGANMAGKSTFLRTISLSIVMANMGLPVCAESFEYSPIKLITSMRTSDSLADDESYFFSELKRLKFIVDEIKTKNYFIILDEI